MNDPAYHACTIQFENLATGKLTVLNFDNTTQPDVFMQTIQTGATDLLSAPEPTTKVHIKIEFDSFAVNGNFGTVTEEDGTHD